MKTKMTIKNQKGAAVVEFAIVLSLMVVFIAGIIEFGILFYNKQVIVNASREGARAGIIAYNSSPPAGEPEGGKYFSNDPAIKSIIEDYCANHLIAFRDAHELDPDAINFTTGDRTIFPFETPFTVTVRYEYSFLLPSLIRLGLTKTITGTTTMLIQQSLE